MRTCQTAPKKIESSERQGERWHVRHERAPSRNREWRKGVEDKGVHCHCFIKSAPNDGEQKRQRKSKGQNRLQSSDPFLYPEKLVSDRSGKRQNRKFGADKAGLFPCPIDLRPREMESILEIIARNGRNIALPPTPSIGKRCVDFPAPY